MQYQLPGPALLTLLGTEVHLTADNTGASLMKKNVGNADRVVRTIAALVVGFFVLTGMITGSLGIILAVIAVVLLATSFVSLCPLYALLGISTRGVKEKTQPAA